MKTVFIIPAGLLLSIAIALAFVPPKHSIVGHWISNEQDGSKMYVEFKSNGKFETHYKGELNHHGNYTFNDPVFSITDNEGCGIGYWGKYNVSFIKKDSISFIVIEDSCTGRREEINGGGLIKAN
jgi:hypothetical protein